MAIYRGAGGSGNSNQDSYLNAVTVQAVIATDAASAASLDATATAADVILTHADVVTTAADVIQTNADVVSAEAAKVAAELAYDSFDDRYLGAKSSAPTTDNDNQALITGALYFNSTSGNMKVYNGSAWLDAYASLSGALTVNNNLSDVADAATARTNLGVPALAHNHIASNITDFDTEVSNNSSVAANTAKTGITSGQASAITANTAKVTNVDHPLVETAVPVGALFTDTDTIYTHPANHAISVITGLQTALDSKLPLAGGTMAGLVNMSDNIIQSPEIKDYSETVQAMAANDVDCTLGNVQTKSIAGSVTLTFSNPPVSGKAGSFTLIATLSATPVITWPASVKWAGGTAPDTVAGIDVFSFITTDAGANWLGFTAGQEMS